MEEGEKRDSSQITKNYSQQGLPLKEDNKSKTPNHDREIFMAILSEPKDQKDNPTALEDLDYDDFLSDAEAAETTTINYEIPPPPPGITVTIHLDNKHNKLKKIQSQKRNINLTTKHHQQLGNSSDYSNSDLHNVINIGRNAKKVIINKGEDPEEVEAYNPTSNYRLPDNYEYNSRKRRSDRAVPPQPTKLSKIDSTHQKFHSRCFLHPKGKHSSFQCIILRKALGAPPPSADKDNKEKNQHEQSFF